MEIKTSFNFAIINLTNYLRIIPSILLITSLMEICIKTRDKEAKGKIAEDAKVGQVDKCSQFP